MPSINKTEKVYSAAEAGEYLGLSHSRIRALVLQGRIKAHVIGRYYVITETELKRFKKLPRHIGKPRESIGAMKAKRLPKRPTLAS
jgi:excisionase family DNA binding protein